MNPNDVELVRVYTREPGGTIPDASIAHVAAGTAVEIVVETEAGATVHGLTPPYTIVIYVRDMMEHHEIDWHNDPARPGAAAAVAGNLGSGDWTPLAARHVVTATSTNFNAGHVYNVLAVVRVGGNIIEFAESAMFIID